MPTITAWMCCASACRRIRTRTFGFRAPLRSAISARARNSRMRPRMKAPVQRRNNLRQRIHLILFASLAAVLFAAVSASARHERSSPDSAQSDNRLTSDLNGTIAVHEGDHIKVRTDLGNIAINTRNTSDDTLSYRMHLETDGRQRDAKQLLKSFTITARATSDGVLLKAEGPDRHGAGRLWVTIDLDIPKTAR